MQDPLTLEAAASAVQTSYDDAVRADQHRVPAEGKTVTHSLTTGGAVAEQSREEVGLAERTAFSVQFSPWSARGTSTFTSVDITHTQFLQNKT